MISIITVCRNSERTIEKTFESVLKQDFNNMEYIVVDGASTDNTWDVIQKYKAKFELRGIRFFAVSEPDDGIYDAMNKGIQLCRGELIGIINSDDQYVSGAFQKMSQASRLNSDVGIYYGILRQMFRGEELALHRYNYDLILTDLSAGIQSAAQHPTCFVRQSVYEMIGLFDTSYALAADYDFLLRAKHKGVLFMALDSLIAEFHLGGACDSTPMQIRYEERYRAQFTNRLISKKKYKSQLRKLQGSPLRKFINLLRSTKK